MKSQKTSIAEALLGDKIAEGDYDARVAEIKTRVAERGINRANDLSLGIELFRLSFKFNSMVASSHLLANPWPADGPASARSSKKYDKPVLPHLPAASSAPLSARSFGYLDRFSESLAAETGFVDSHSSSVFDNDRTPAARFGRPTAPRVYEKNSSRIQVALNSSAHMALHAPKHVPDTGSTSSSTIPDTTTALLESESGASLRQLRRKSAPKITATSSRAVAKELGIAHESIIAQTQSHGFSFSHAPRLPDTEHRDSLGPGAFDVKPISSAYRQRRGLAVPMSSEAERGEKLLQHQSRASVPGPGSYNPKLPLKHTPTAHISMAPPFDNGLHAQIPGPGKYHLPSAIGTGPEIGFGSATRLVPRPDALKPPAVAVSTDIVDRNKHIRTVAESEEALRLTAQRRDAAITAAAERRNLREFERVCETQKDVKKWQGRVAELTNKKDDAVDAEISASDSLVAAVAATQQSSSSGPTPGAAVLSASMVRARSWLIISSLINRATHLRNHVHNVRLFRVVFKSWVRAAVKIQRAFRHWMFVTNTARVNLLCTMLRNVFGMFVVNFRIRKKQRAAQAISHFLAELKLRRKQDLVTMARIYKRKVRRIQFWWRHRMLPKLRAQTAALVQQLDCVQLELEHEEKLLLEQPNLAVSLGPQSSVCPVSVSLIAALAVQDRLNGRQVLVSMGLSTQTVDANGMPLDLLAAPPPTLTDKASEDRNVLMTRASLVGLGTLDLNMPNLEHLSVLELVAEVAIADDKDRARRYVGNRLIPIPIKRGALARRIRETTAAQLAAEVAVSHHAPDTTTEQSGDAVAANRPALQRSPSLLNISPLMPHIIPSWFPMVPFGGKSKSTAGRNTIVNKIKKPLPHALKVVLARHILRCKRQAFVARCREWRKRRAEFASKRERSQEAAFERARLLLTLDSARATTLTKSLALFDASNPRPFTSALLTRSAAARVVRKLQAHVDATKRSKARAAHAAALAAAMGIEVSQSQPVSSAWAAGANARIKYVHQQLYLYAATEREFEVAEESSFTSGDEATMAALLDSFSTRAGHAHVATAAAGSHAHDHMHAPMPPSSRRASVARRRVSVFVAQPHVELRVYMTSGIYLNPTPYVGGAARKDPRDFCAMRVLQDIIPSRALNPLIGRSISSASTATTVSSKLANVIEEETEDGDDGDTARRL